MKENFHKETFAITPKIKVPTKRGNFFVVAADARLWQEMNDLVLATGMSKSELIRLALTKFFERVSVLKKEADRVK